MGKITWLPALAVWVALAAGCRSGPTQACVDIVETTAHADARCGADYETARTAVESSFTRMHGCGSARSVRDKDALYGTCLPWIEGLTCAQLADPSLVIDPSCDNQITLVYYVP